MSTSIDELNSKFSVPGLRFDKGKGDLIKGVVKTEQADAEIYLHGAHITHFKPRDRRPVLWLSQKSAFAADKPIRGGVPICFPWFGPHPDDSNAPVHGLVRLKSWVLTSAQHNEGEGLVITLQTSLGPFALQFSAAFSSAMKLSLTVSLDASAGDSKAIPGLPAFEEAFHTYLAVGSIHQVSIEGLESSGYIDKVDRGRSKQPAGQAIRFTEELDRVYQDTVANCIVRDPAFGRSIVIEKANSHSSVVWNPWIAKSVRMPDFGDNEWPDMVCVETANVGDHAISLKPGGSHTMTTRISVIDAVQ